MQHDPIYALEFYDEIDHNGNIQKKYPTLYKNLVVRYLIIKVI